MPTHLFVGFIAGLLVICIGLVMRKKWAWWTATILCVCIILGAAFLLWSVAHPSDVFSSSESGFGLSVVLVMSSIGGIPLVGLLTTRKLFSR